MYEQLVEKIKTEGISVHPFNENSRFMTDFGLTKNLRGWLYDSVEPHNNFDWLASFMSPEPIRVEMSRSNDKLHELYRRSIFAVHYRINSQRFYRNLDKLIKMEATLSTASDGRYKSPYLLATERATIEQMKLDFHDRYCIYTNLDLSSVLVGSRQLTTEIMRLYKASPKEMFTLTDELYGQSYSAQNDVHQRKSIDIYDMVNRPKELHVPIHEPAF